MNWKIVKNPSDPPYFTLSHICPRYAIRNKEIYFLRWSPKIRLWCGYCQERPSEELSKHINSLNKLIKL
jgi:hypothetical protein